MSLDLYHKSKNHKSRFCTFLSNFESISSTREAAEVAKDRAAGLTLDDSVIEIFWSKPVDKQIYNTRKQLTKIFSQGLQSGGRMGDGLGFGGGGSG